MEGEIYPSSRLSWAQIIRINALLISGNRRAKISDAVMSKDFHQGVTGRNFKWNTRKEIIYNDILNTCHKKDAFLIKEKRCTTFCQKINQDRHLKHKSITSDWDTLLLKNWKNLIINKLKIPWKRKIFPKIAITDFIFE